MRRLHLFEWEDQPWLPVVFRDFITDHLRYTSNEPMRQPVNVAIAHRLHAVLERSGASRIVDLCAGAGGPLPSIHQVFSREFQWPVEVVLTDLYPNVEAFKRMTAASGGAITGRYQPTSAFDVPEELDGVRTIFTALHHFKPDEVRRILADAVRKRAPIAVFEPLERSLRMVTLIGAASLARGFTHTPRVGALTLPRFLVTYLLPLAPVLFAWDGVVSALRTYNSEELLSLARSTSEKGYQWEGGSFDVMGPYGRMPTTFLTGLPMPR